MRLSLLIDSIMAWLDEQGLGMNKNGILLSRGSG